MQVYDCALEDIPEFNGFTDFCDTFQIMAGDDDDDEGQEVIGEFKVGIAISDQILFYFLLLYSV